MATKGRTGPRSNLRDTRLRSAAFGARHNLVWSNTAATFFKNLQEKWEEILTPREFQDAEAANNELSASDAADRLAYVRSLFKLYDDQGKAGASVFERRLSSEQGSRGQLRWTPNDVGIMRGRIQDRVDRLNVEEMFDNDGNIPVIFDQVVRVGDAGGRNGNRKFALVINQESATAGLLIDEHEIVADGLSHTLKKFRYPYDEYVPHMTIGSLQEAVHMPNVDSCLVAAKSLLPLTVAIEPIRFFAHQEL